MLEAVAIGLLVIVAVCVFILWVLVQIAIVMIPLIGILLGGYGLFFLATMAAGSPRSRRALGDDGGEEETIRKDSGGLGEWFD